MLLFLISSKTKRGRERKGRNHPEISSQKVADFECGFPYESYGKNRAPFWPLFPFWEKDFGGKCPAAPSSPGPFVLLLIQIFFK